ANWPTTGRSLVIDHTYHTALLKDPVYKSFLSYGSTDPIRKAKIQESYNFENIHVVPNLISYGPAGEHLTGFICHQNALLVATSPVSPAPEVRNLLSRYEIITDPQTGISFEYRQMGNSTLDSASDIVECSFGANVGVA